MHKLTEETPTWTSTKMQKVKANGHKSNSFVLRQTAKSSALYELI